MCGWAATSVVAVRIPEVAGCGLPSLVLGYFSDLFSPVRSLAVCDVVSWVCCSRALLRDSRMEFVR